MKWNPVETLKKVQSMFVQQVNNIMSDHSLKTYSLQV